MSEELIAQLRMLYDYEGLVSKAADAIEELRRENEQLKAEVQNWERSFPMCHMGIEGECSAEQRWKAIVAEQRAEVEQLKAENLVQLAKMEGQRIALVNLTAFVEACGGLSPEAVEWAIRIAAELMDEWEEGSTHADTYYVVERWWRPCPPSVRAALRSNGGES